MKNNLANMMCLDVFLSSQETSEYEAIKDLLTPNVSIKSPLISFDFYNNYFSSEMEFLDLENDINHVKGLACKFNWKNNFDKLFNDQEFDAIVITDINQKIVWVNDGFSKMTGYHKSFALKKSPYFLQGENTSLEAKKRIRKKIANDTPFQDVVINYKKNKTPYTCELKIFPLFSEKTTHYIALEKKVVSFET
ncbi:PAS domain-containing protein [uncultured Polaribacter sp.]|uniref:PAS domain-containing protein n=1 Tax=uncultured Polaribacter sp. TaxID=174711 RepID=UPI0026364FF8|nr:PAS domain-containing protein [uncultured Polaribacter sp.]